MKISTLSVIIAEQIEFNIKPTTKNGNIKALVYLSQSCNDHEKVFKDMTRQDIIDHLNTFRKSVVEDPSITERGINYLKKQGEFKESVTNISTQTINNSPKAQIMTDSPHGRQNIGSRNESIISKLIKLIRSILHL